MSDFLQLANQSLAVIALNQEQQISFLSPRAGKLLGIPDLPPCTPLKALFSDEALFRYLSARQECSEECLSVVINNQPHTLWYSLLHDDTQSYILFWNLVAPSPQSETKFGEAHSLSFLATLAHEMKTPLSNISAAAQLLDILYPDNSKHKQIIHRGCNRLDRMLRNVLDLASTDRKDLRLSRSRFDAVVLMKELYEELENMVELQEASFRLSCSVEKAMLFADKEKIERILLNLISNALKYKNTNGSDPSFIELGLDCTDEQVLFSVRDNGIGIDPKYHNKIFKRFFRINQTSVKPTEGSGLGLAISFALAQLHGGTILLESEVGVGSCFTVVIPKRQSEKPCALLKQEPLPYTNSLHEQIVYEFSDFLQ